MSKVILKSVAILGTLGLGSLAGPFLCGRCGSQGLAPAEAAAPKNEATRTVTVQVEGMTCASCGVTVRIAVKKLYGVKEAKVNVSGKEAAVEYDPAKVTPEKIVEAINNVGYHASLAKP